MNRVFSLHRTVPLVLFGAVVVAAVQAGCGSSARSASESRESAPGFGPGVEPDAASTLDITPSSATVDVTIVDGIVTASPLSFIASHHGRVVPASWSIDRGELGDVDANGVFSASGTGVGVVTLTARFGEREGTSRVKVVIHARQNGAASPDSAGRGGRGGVGGEPLGGAVDASIVTKLRAAANASSAAELAFLYPYDRTVWPRGLLPPLLMWQSSRSASAVYVKLSQGNYVFEGTYDLGSLPEGGARRRVRLEDTPWRVATSGNEGDDLRLELKIYSPSDDRIIGPITRTWKVAPGVLKGTVYYSSYDSAVTTSGSGQTQTQTGGVIQIRPRSPEPQLAIPSMAGTCHGCHVVSADGSTLFAQDGNTEHYQDGASYDLKQPSAPRTPYLTGVNAENARKFVWSAPYPDGSFALASAGYAREAYVKGASELFKRADGARISSANLDAVTSAVTPAFSPDGRKVAFNFWAGPGAGGVTAGGGHSLAMFDFTCGAPAGSVTCAPGATPTFGNLRQIYRDGARWPGWPSFLPDGKAVVFHDTLRGGDLGEGSDCRASTVNPPPNANNCQLTTWHGATAEIWLARDSGTQNARRLDALNGIAPDGTRYLPMAGNHPSDEVLNYMPTVNPVASGGYSWVVFTSRRLYGNLLTGDSHGGTSPQKKLWVAAIDLDDPGASADPSHPAFYLPGQELGAGNTRGFWVVDPCKANGGACETGDECCGGFCRKDASGAALVCQEKPSGQCSQEFERCAVDADCCEADLRCIASKCTRHGAVVK